jgi:YVTN family beta-propeller protein
MSGESRLSRLSRARWAAIGAAVAVSLGAGGIGIVNATISSGSKAVYVPIAPCRLADTRPAPDTVGTKNTPIGPNQTHTFTVRGTNGNCTIPTGATAIVANVTAVGPTAQSFMTIWPADKPQPNASSLNYSAGQAPFPNAVTVTLSADGKIKAANKNGNVNLIIDIAGYYEDHDHDDRYDTKAQVEAKVVERTTRLTDSQIARLRWDQDPGRAATFLVANGPYGAAFDGSHIWVAAAGSINVSKIDPATNAVTAVVNVGGSSVGVAFDGTHIWVSNYNDDKVTKIDPITNTVVGSVGVGTGPAGMAFDGTHIWVANQLSGNVSKIDVATNAVTTVVVGPGTFGVAYDGTSIWVTSGGSNKVFKIKPSDNTLVSVDVGTNPQGVAFDGTSIWVANSGSNNVSRINPTTPAVTATISVGVSPRALAFDGTSIWVTNYGSNNLSKIGPATNTVTAVVGVGIGFSPIGIMFDGTNLWVTNNSSGDISKIIPF